MKVEFPAGTGEVARLLKVAEHRLQGAVRKGTVSPRCANNRRQWTAIDVLIVARHLGVDSPDLRNALTNTEAANGAASDLEKETGK